MLKCLSALNKGREVPATSFKATTFLLLQLSVHYRIPWMNSQKCNSLQVLCPRGASLQAPWRSCLGGPQTCATGGLPP